jgi:benzil reductase ((S)-benzoin forming)
MKAVVTGHTKGLGEAITRALLERGISVLGLARGPAPQLASSFPGLLDEVQLDLSDAAALSAWLEGPALKDWLDGCDTAILVNNAGMVSPVGALDQQDPLAVIKAVTLNVAAPMALSAALVRAAGNAQKRVLHISSGAGRNAIPGWSVYGSTKAALDHHAKVLAADGGEQLKACSLAPGVIDTGMQAEIRATPQDRFPLRERFLQMKNEGVLVAPEQAGRAVVEYLLGAQFGASAVADIREL